MIGVGVIQTERLILRRWRDADSEPYAAMMADPEVGHWLGGARDHAAALAEIERIKAGQLRDGLGWRAVQRLSDGAFLGAAGIMRLNDGHPVGPGIEVGWRFARDAWGRGYASEAARALLEEGFRRLAPPEIVAFTAVENLRSRAVMERLGMRRDADRDFDHPNLAADHPLRRHVVYAAARRSSHVGHAKS